MSLSYRCSSCCTSSIKVKCFSTKYTTIKCCSISVSIIEEAAADLDLRPRRPLPSLSGDDEELVPERVAYSSRDSLLATGNSGQDNKPASALQIPMESYVERQKSLGFFSGLVGRLR